MAEGRDSKAIQEGVREHSFLFGLVTHKILSISLCSLVCQFWRFFVKTHGDIGEIDTLSADGSADGAGIVGVVTVANIARKVISYQSPV
jgi:hypothetical protein